MDLKLWVHKESDFYKSNNNYVFSKIENNNSSIDFINTKKLLVCQIDLDDDFHIYYPKSYHNKIYKNLRHIADKCI